jgi:hypothetical protein
MQSSLQQIGQLPTLFCPHRLYSMRQHNFLHQHNRLNVPFMQIIRPFLHHMHSQPRLRLLRHWVHTQCHCNHSTLHQLYHNCKLLAVLKSNLLQFLYFRFHSDLGSLHRMQNNHVQLLHMRKCLNMHFVRTWLHPNFAKHVSMQSSLQQLGQLPTLFCPHRLYSMCQYNLFYKNNRLPVSFMQRVRPFLHHMHSLSSLRLL